MLLFILSSERYNDRATGRTVSEIGRRGVMTRHHREEERLLPLDSIPTGNRDIDNLSASHHRSGIERAVELSSPSESLNPAKTTF
jgi:hypothetical protein